MEYVDSLNILGQEVRQIPCIVGDGPPTATIEGAAGCLYIDTNTGDLYKCTSEPTDGHTSWEMVHEAPFAVSYADEQDLTEDEQAVARENIGAVGIDDILEATVTPVQTVGDSESDVMSQKAVTDIVVPFSVECGNVIWHSDYALNKDGNPFTPTGVLYKTTHTIPCVAGDVFGYIGRADYSFAAAQFYNAIGTYMGCVQTTAGVKPSEELEIVIPAGVVYVRFCSYGTRSTIEDIPLKVWKKDKSKQDNPLYGKKIAVNGDSICYGAGSTGGYAKIIGENNNMTVQNVGISGGTVAAETYAKDTAANDIARHWISRTIANMDETADFAILEGGVNDASLGVTMGEMSSGYNGDFDDTTFIGAFESMLCQLVTRFAGKKYGYIAVHQMTENYRVGNDEETSYYYAAKKCCEKWGVPFLDLNTSVPPFAFFGESNEGLNALKTAYTHNGDGWHPNEEGYKKYYVPKIEAWLKTL